MAIVNFIPTVWSATLQETLNQTYIGAAHCNRAYEGEIKEKGSTVRICGVQDVTIGDYMKNTDIHAPQVLSDKNAYLSINQAKYFNFLIDDIDRAQAMPELMDMALKNAANAITKATDSYIFSMYREAGHTIDCPSTTGPDIINAIIDARTKLLISGVSDPNDIVIEITPEIASLIMKAKIEINSDNTAVLEKGCIGNIFGSPIFVSSNVQKEEMPDSVTHHCLVRTKRAVAFAEQLSEIEAYRPELRFADAMKGLHLFGAKVIYPKEIASVNVVFPVEEVDLG